MFKQATVLFISNRNTEVFFLRVGSVIGFHLKNVKVPVTRKKKKSALPYSYCSELQATVTHTL